MVALTVAYTYAACSRVVGAVSYGPSPTAQPYGPALRASGSYLRLRWQPISIAACSSRTSYLEGGAGAVCVLAPAQITRRVEWALSSELELQPRAAEQREQRVGVACRVSTDDLQGESLSW